MEINNPTYPYPPRSSEIVKGLVNLSEIAPIALTESENLELDAFENALFSKYKSVSEISISEHIIHPDVFTDGEGKRIFAAVYLDPEISKKADEKGAEKLFDEILEASRTEDEFLKYIKSNNLSLPRMGDLDSAGIQKLFLEADLKNIPIELRKKVNNYSSEKDKLIFIREYKRTKGDLEKVNNPERVSKVVNPEKLNEKLEGLHNLKTEIKSMTREVATDNSSNLSQAKRIVLDIYRKRINISLADNYEYKGQNARSKERMDHFLNGVGEGGSLKGLFPTIPARLEEYAKDRVQDVEFKSDEYNKYNSILVDSNRAKEIAELILDEYGINGGENGWKVVLLESRSTLGVQYKSGSKFVREIRIPKNYSRGLIDTLSVLAHEVEGHVVRFINREKALKKSIKLFDEKTSGRGSALSEGASMLVEAKTQMMIAGSERKAEPYYYLALKEKINGGSFKDCFNIMASTYAERVWGSKLADVFEDEEKFSDMVEYAYTRTLRVFRKNTPFSDRSGYIASSDTLDYIEQEIVLKQLNEDLTENNNLNKVIYVSGVDLYSVSDLQKLGRLNLSLVEEPKLVVANKVWPSLKKSVDEGRGI